MRTPVSTSPIKGFRDFPPEEWAVQQLIFDVWAGVSKSYGFEEYNGPVLEDVNIYNKSGSDVGTLGKELYAFEDRGGRFIALRPEMTPSVGRMIAEYGKNYPKPIRWFSIAQFFRAENPQKGRGREFYQLNADIFGDDSIYSDFEVIALAVDIMRAFGAREEMFVLRINNRKLTDYYFQNILNINDPEVKAAIMRVIDASPKKTREWFEAEILKYGDKTLVEKIDVYLNLKPEDLSAMSVQSQGAKELLELWEIIKSAGIDKYCVFDTSMARGFDYYTGMVLEVFDKNPENRRSMFGGGRYDDLLDVFGRPKIPAVGFAPGDMTIRIFLENWKLLENLKANKMVRYYMPMLLADSLPTMIGLAEKLRAAGNIVQLGLKEEHISKALSYANRISADKCVIIGQEEIDGSFYKIKDLKTGKEDTIKLSS